jgi:hypothetical protein
VRKIQWWFGAARRQRRAPDVHARHDEVGDDEVQRGKQDER